MCVRMEDSYDKCPMCGCEALMNDYERWYDDAKHYEEFDCPNCGAHLTQVYVYWYTLAEGKED